MLVIALFALIGAMIDAWPAYWIVFSAYCVCWTIAEAIKRLKD